MNDLFGADPADPSATLGLAGPVASVSGLTVTTNPTTGTLSLNVVRVRACMRFLIAPLRLSAVEPDPEIRASRSASWKRAVPGYNSKNRTAAGTTTRVRRRPQRGL